MLTFLCDLRMRSASAEARRACESKERPGVDGARRGRQLWKPSHKWVKDIRETFELCPSVISVRSFFLGQEIPAAVQGADGGEEA